jgi:membrane protease subunit HflK
VQTVRTQRLSKLEFGFATPSPTNEFQPDAEPAETGSMVTGDLNMASVLWVIQYRIADPKLYLFHARNPEVALRDVSESVMREVVGDRTVDEVLTIGRHEIETTALVRIREIVGLYGLGFDVAQVQLATVAPPAGVQIAFNEVNQAQQEKQTAINQAWSEYNDAVPKVRGEADQRLRQADAYAVRRINEASGEVEKFSLLLAEYRKAPQITKRRLYLEAMRDIMPGLQKKVIVDDSVKGIIPLMNLAQP